ncbi:dipeptidase [Tahibacter amnicola]|uniref:Dipeptidase n=1 Tax=Tahibacter amnicola TaxID=2976241 RepID=A0ABY6B9E4_9GAMM|nr:dipeptidase [Tahibacter amnicola]UXI66294.1 dipeptidase [Tahibacter amnicola]
MPIYVTLRILARGDYRALDPGVLLAIQRTGRCGVLNRREWLVGAGMATLHAALGGAVRAAEPAADGAATWTGYKQSLPIDGASGFDFLFLETEAEIRKELEIVRAAGMGAVLTTAGPNGRYWLDDEAIARAGKTVDQWHAIAARHPEHIFIVEKGADLTPDGRRGRTGIILGFQGTEPLGENPDRIASYRKAGVRVIQLTHNRRNLVGDGCMEPGNAGLSRFGHEVVERLNAERVVMDLAHGAPRTIEDAIRAAKAPMLISHTGCRALADLPRNVSDAQLRAMAGRGGVAGIIFWPYLRKDTQPMAVDVIAHIEHALKVCGEDHVGIGTDISVRPVDRTPDFEKENREFMKAMVEDGIFERGRPADLYTFIPDLNMANRFEVLAAMLSRRGHPDSRIAKILGGNFARVMREIWG